MALSICAYSVFGIVIIPLQNFDNKRYCYDVLVGGCYVSLYLSLCKQNSVYFIILRIISIGKWTEVFERQQHSCTHTNIQMNLHVSVFMAPPTRSSSKLIIGSVSLPLSANTVICLVFLCLCLFLSCPLCLSLLFSFTFHREYYFESLIYVRKWKLFECWILHSLTCYIRTHSEQFSFYEIGSSVTGDNEIISNRLHICFLLCENWSLGMQQLNKTLYRVRVRRLRDVDFRFQMNIYINV